TDFATGRKLDLDKSYRLLIKPAVESKGLECIRADEIRHAGTIDLPMYQELLTAAVVAAPLSTANPNAFYELGIRHALRPRTTIVISEDKLPLPFDLHSLSVFTYQHLGDAIEFDEVMRFRQVLGDTIEACLQDQQSDSPVYTFLTQLTPPVLGRQAAQTVMQAGQVLEQAGQASAAVATSMRTSESREKDPTPGPLLEEGEQAIK